MAAFGAALLIVCLPGLVLCGIGALLERLARDERGESAAEVLMFGVLLLIVVVLLMFAMFLGVPPKAAP
jgi:hypothetical protein